MTILNSEHFFKYTFIFKETKCTIITDKPETVEIAQKSIVYHRKQLESYIKANPKFLYSFEPIKVDDGPEIVKLMASASVKAEVGPMAAVAGALADLAVKEMISFGAKTAVVENGGEISAISETPINIALLAGNLPISGKIGFRLESFPTGIATSSGILGHAISLGEAEAVTIFSKEACLADAAATAVCNIVKGENPGQAVRCGIERALSIDGVEGALVIYKGKIAFARKIPKLIRIVNGGQKPRLQKRN